MYPVTLSLKGRSCLVVGGGSVALRKVESLLAEGARVTVIAPSVGSAIRELDLAGKLALELRPYRNGEAAGFDLVLAATDRREVNRRIFDDAEAAGVWANVADDPELCSFHLPARVRRGPLELTVATAGEAPFATRRLRQLLERRFGPEWEGWAQAAARFRQRVRRLKLSADEQEARFNRFFSETVEPERLRPRVPSDEELANWAEPSAGRGVPTPSSGFVSLVGSGPGCPGLLTVRGRQRLLAAGAVVYDRLAAPALPCDLPSATELHAVGKEAGRHPVPQEEINALLVRLAHEGKRVVRFKGGDPYVFGRGGEEAEALEAAGVPFEIVPGVTSGIAAAAWAGIPVTHRQEAVSVTLLTAHESSKADGPQLRWDLLSGDPHATLVGYMGVSALPDVIERLLGAGLPKDTPAAVIENGTTPAQRSVIATLAGLPEAAERAGVRPPALFVIGPTVHHAERLDWRRRLPLAGERLVIAAGAGGLTEALESAGAEVLEVPLPLTPAARVVMDALPLTGFVLRAPSEVEPLAAGRSAAAGSREPPVWCLGAEVARRARATGWNLVQDLEEPATVQSLVERIVAWRVGAA